MMATTHVLAGMALASATTLIAPEQTPVAVAGAAVGGAFPDLDLYGDHRRTLHYPVYYSITALVAVTIAVLAPTVVTIALAAFLASAALHSAMDAFGGGLELKPWEGASDRAVYDHYRGRWIRPRRWIRYDGAPEDVAFAGVLAVPMVLVADGVIQQVVLALLVLSVLYGIVRKPLVVAAELLVDVLPDHVVERLPGQFVEDVS